MANQSNCSFKIKGLAELDKKLGNLQQAASDRILKQAVKEGADPIYDEIREGVISWGEETGTLRDSVKVKVRKSTKYDNVFASIGVFRIKSIEPLPGNPYPVYIGAPTLAWWFEYGIQPHYLGKKSKRKTGKVTGGALHPGVPAKPVIRKAIPNNATAATKKISDVLRKKVDQIAKSK